VSVDHLSGLFADDSPGIAYLSLRSNDVTDEGALILADAIRDRKIAGTLDLCDNRITAVGVRALCNALDALSENCCIPGVEVILSSGEAQFDHDDGNRCRSWIEATYGMGPTYYTMIKGPPL
jgi:hypothetical protein